jgi:hypothetical protein
MDAQLAIETKQDRTGTMTHDSVTETSGARHRRRSHGPHDNPDAPRGARRIAASARREADRQLGAW